MTDYKKPVPDDRTVVPGIWSDILDDWSNSFASSESGETSGRVIISNTEKLALDMFRANIELISLNSDILEQMRLLNLRFEEAFNTKLNEGDL